jgi:2-dehydro-3-deoxy-D-arabinonate dehydratase
LAKLLCTSDDRCGWLTGDGIISVDEPLTALEDGGPAAADAQAPLDLVFPFAPPEVWASGVTYERSRSARAEETHVPDVYSLVYDAARAESTWTVPEPELALVIGRGGRIVGATIGNDVTARDVEAVNPLYLSQAKIFAGSCAIGPLVITWDEWPEEFEIRRRILRARNQIVWEAETTTAKMKRSFDELAAWLMRDNPVAPGTIILTGTGLVPPDHVALQPGDVVEIDVPRIGCLSNPVVAASQWPGSAGIAGERRL